MTGNVMEIAVDNCQYFLERSFLEREWFYIFCWLFVVLQNVFAGEYEFFQTTSVDRRELRAFDATKNDTFAMKKILTRKRSDIALFP